MKKVSFIFVSLLFVTGFLFALIAHIAPAQAAPKVFELKLSSHKPPMAAPIKVFQEWAKKVEEATNGRVKITVYSASSLVKNEDIIPSTKRGICDIGDLVIYSERQKYPLTAILNFPFMNLGNPKDCMKIWMALEEKFPQMKEEHKGFKILNRTTTTGGSLHMCKKSARVPADLKGMKIVASGHLARALKSQGTSPLSIRVPDWYSSLDRGLAEGIFLHYMGVHETKIYELLPYHTDFSGGWSLHTEEMIMSLDTWNKFPPDIQKVFDDLSPWTTERLWEAIEEANTKGINAMKEVGHTFMKTTPEEEKLWYELCAAIHKEWIEAQEAKGLPARAVYEEALRLANQHKQ